MGTNAKPFFSRIPKLTHALYGVPVFTLAGPIFGSIAAGLSSGSPLAALNPLVLFGAYAVGFGPAFIAGYVYCALSLLCVRLFPRVILGGFFGGVVGVAAGLSGVLIYTLALFPQLAWRPWLAAVGCVAGAVCGILLGRLVPVGRDLPRRSAEA